MDCRIANHADVIVFTWTFHVATLVEAKDGESTNAARLSQTACCGVACRHDGCSLCGRVWVGLGRCVAAKGGVATHSSHCNDIVTKACL